MHTVSVVENQLLVGHARWQDLWLYRACLNKKVEESQGSDLHSMDLLSRASLHLTRSHKAIYALEYKIGLYSQ